MIIIESISISFESETWSNPLSLTIVSGDLDVLNISSKTSLAIFPEIFSDIINLISFPKLFGLIGEFIISIFLFLRKAKSSEVIQLTIIFEYFTSCASESITASK